MHIYVSYTSHRTMCMMNINMYSHSKFKQQKKTADDLDEVLSMKEVVEEVDDSVIALQNMQRKDPIPKYLFSDHVRNMHRDKDKNFISEFAVSETSKLRQYNTVAVHSTYEYHQTYFK